MNQMTDKLLVDIISKGGSAVGKSSFMPAWGGALDEKQVRDIGGLHSHHGGSSLQGRHGGE